MSVSAWTFYWKSWLGVVTALSMKLAHWRFGVHPVICQVIFGTWMVLCENFKSGMPACSNFKICIKKTRREIFSHVARESRKPESMFELVIWVSGWIRTRSVVLHTIFISFWVIYEGGLREPASGQIGSFGRGQKLQTPISPVFLCILIPAFYFAEPHLRITRISTNQKYSFQRIESFHKRVLNVFLRKK